MVWILLGAPGAGKGTQAEKLASHLGVPHVSTGDRLRRAVGEGTDLGRRAKSFMDRGDLVPDELILGIVREALEEGSGRGAILDGYPRNTAQADALAGMLGELGLRISGAIELDVAEAVLVHRIAKRAAEQGRTDDTEETVRNRLAVYHEQTAPLVSYYEEKGLLKRICGEGTVPEIQGRLREITAGAEASG